MVREGGTPAPLLSHEATKSDFICVCPLLFSLSQEYPDSKLAGLGDGIINSSWVTSSSVGSRHFTEQSSPVHPFDTFVYSKVSEGLWAGIRPSAWPAGRRHRDLHVQTMEFLGTCVCRMRVACAFVGQTGKKKNYWLFAAINHRIVES